MPTSYDSARHVHRAQGAVITASAGPTPRQVQAARRHRRRVIFWLAVALLRDRRFRQNAIVAIVILVALAQLAREGGARTRGRLVAWLEWLPEATVKELSAIEHSAIDRTATDRSAIEPPATDRPARLDADMSQARRGFRHRPRRAAHATA